MNIDKFTQKSIEAVNGCEKLAMEYGNQEIEQEHLLYSLLTLDDSLILKLVEKMEIQKDQESQQGDRRDLEGIRHHQRTFPAGIVYRKRQPESHQ